MNANGWMAAVRAWVRWGISPSTVDHEADIREAAEMVVRVLEEIQGKQNEYAISAAVDSELDYYRKLAKGEE